MNRSKLARPLALLSAAAALLVSPNPKQDTIPLGRASACAEGTCCPQQKSWCAPNSHDLFKDEYYLSSGACTS